MISILFDTETTGLLLPSTAPLEKQPYIIELGAVKVNEHGAVLGQLEQLLLPPVPITAEITKITGIQQADVADKPTFAEFLPRLIQFFSGAGHTRADTLICHNAQIGRAHV